MGNNKKSLNFAFNLSIFQHVHCRSRTKVSQSAVYCKILHINYRNICRVDCKNMPPNTHKLVNCSWPNTHDAVEYQSRCTCSALTGTAYIHSLRRQPHTGYQGPSTAHIATTARGEVRHCRGLWGINICPPSLAVTHHYSYHHQCNVCVRVCPMCKRAKEGIAC